MADDDDKDANVWRIDGTVFVCEVPPALGRVTKLSLKGGKVVAETESGTPMIVPTKANN